MHTYFLRHWCWIQNASTLLMVCWSDYLWGSTCGFAAKKCLKKKHSAEQPLLFSYCGIVHPEYLLWPKGSLIKSFHLLSLLKPQLSSSLCTVTMATALIVIVPYSVLWLCVKHTMFTGFSSRGEAELSDNREISSVNISKKIQMMECTRESWAGNNIPSSF